MTTLSSIQSFLQPKQLAIAGVSRNPKKFGRHVYEHLKEHGYKLYPVNPNMEDLDGEVCYKSISDLPGEVDRIYIVTPQKETAESVRQSIDKGIRKIWIQQRSETPETLELMKDQDIDLIYKKCILMFAEPVKGPHAFHRLINKLFGSYPKQTQKS
ncbi:CoA-binding protein [Bacteroidota bacterium]